MVAGALNAREAPTRPSSPASLTAYPADTTAILLRLQHEYAASGASLSVSFRDLVPWLKMGERATHYLHSYPAKLLPQIAHFFLAARGWLPCSEVVLDPFAGTGTVALEANLSGRRAYYADVNPLARLITSAKTGLIDAALASAALHAISARFNEVDGGSLPWVVNMDYWYTPAAKLDLARLRRSIIEVCPDHLHSFVWATYSAASRKCSRANPRFAVPVRLPSSKEAPCRSVWSVFRDQFSANLQRQSVLKALATDGATSTCVGDDARSLRWIGSGPLPDESVGCILTSPPYAGAQKYIRASSLSLGWLGLTRACTLKELEKLSIGREHFRKETLTTLPATGIKAADDIISEIHKINPVRAAICANYLCEMAVAIREMHRVLKPGGKVIIVIGDNMVCGRRFPSSLFLCEMLKGEGLRMTLKLVDEIRSRGLLTKRSGGAPSIDTETIMVFEK